MSADPWFAAILLTRTTGNEPDLVLPPRYPKMSSKVLLMPFLATHPKWLTLSRMVEISHSDFRNFFPAIAFK